MHIRYVRRRFPYFHLFLSVCGTVLLFAHSTTSFNCYVCGLDENSIACDNFNPSNKDLYAKECPPNSRGCSTQTKGEQIINMACENYPLLNDCKPGNGIEYCHCNFNLCNGNKSIKKSITISSIGLNDDEDLNEGSGYNKIFSTSGPTISTFQSSVQPPNTGHCLHSTFVVIAAAILLP